MSNKEVINAQDVCDLLNETLKLDYDCIKDLVNLRSNCNNDNLENHPNIMIRKFKEDEIASLGIIGLLNGLFEANYVIGYEIDDDNKILEFKLIEKEVKNV